MSCPSRHHQHLLHGRTKTLLSHKPGVVPADVEGQEPLEIRVVDGGDYLFLGDDYRIESSRVKCQALTDLDLHSAGSLFH